MAFKGLAPLGSQAGRLRLTPEEEDSLLNDLAGAGTSALGYIGDILGTPAGAIRNVLAGRFEDVLPGILDPERRISGRDLAKQYGLTGVNYEGLDLGDVIGFGTEVATDPLTFVGGGGTAAGGIAKQLGKFPKRSLFDAGTGAMTLGKRTARRGTLGSALEGADDLVMKQAAQLAEQRGGTLADFMNEPMQRSLGVGLPFQENAFTFDLPGAAFRAEKLDKVGGIVRASAPARYLAKMFDSRAGDVGDWAGQTVKMAASDEADPAKMAAGAQLNRFHLDLGAHGIADQDLQTDILEGITRNPEAPQGTRLSEQEILDYNVQPFDGEAPEALQARKLAIRDVRKSFHDSQEGLRVQKEKLGLPAARYESQRVDYLPREATYPKYEKLNTGMRRRDPPRDLGRTEVDAILKDEQLRTLSKQTEIDPLSPEQLTRPVPAEVERDLANMGYEDLKDLVPWQADHMRNADPQREAWNAVAEAKALPPTGFVTSSGSTYELSGASTRRNKAARGWQPGDSGLKTPSELTVYVDPQMAKEIGMWQTSSASGKRIVVKDGKVVLVSNNPTTGKPGLDRIISDATLHDTPTVGLSPLELWKQKDGAWSSFHPGSPISEIRNGAEGAARPEMSRTTALPKPKLHTERMQEAVKRADELLGRNPEDWDKMPEWLDTARELPKLQKEMEELRQAGLAGDYAAPLADQEVAIELQLGNAMKAREEYAARRQMLDARDINSRDDFLKNDEVEQLAALRGQALEIPKWRARLKKVQERIAKGEREMAPGELMDNLQAEMGAAEVAQAQLDALAARAKEAKYFIQHAREVPQEAIDKGHRFYGNAAMHDATVQRTKDIEKLAFTKQAHKSFAANAEYIPPGTEVDKTKFVPWTDAVRSLGVGKTATQQANAIRTFAEEARKYGKIDDATYQNIAGPHAVATSAVKGDEVVAQALRKQEVDDFTARMSGELQKRTALLQKKFKGAELEKQVAFMQDEFRAALTNGRSVIEAKPLEDMSQAGQLMKIKRGLHEQLQGVADEARLSGQMDDEAYQALRSEADDWLKGATKGTSEEVQKFQQMWEQAVAQNPIPNDGLLRMRNMYVPKDLADSLVNAAQFRGAPKSEGFLGWADWWRNLTKGHLTMPFPGFHVRNLFNMVYQYGNAGVRDPRHGLVKGFVQPWKDAWEILQGRVVNDFDSIPAIKAMGLKGDEAHRQIVAAAESYGGLQGAGDIISEGAEPAFMPFGKKEHKWGSTTEAYTNALPGGRPLNKDYLLEPLAAKFGKQRFNPANREQFAGIALGARLSNTTENVGRLATFIGLLRQGYGFEEAGGLMKAMHVDYSKLTQFERNVARRFAPFYSWSRGMVPYAIKQFIEKPAGLYAQTARLARVAEQDAGFLPPQLSGSLAIPIGEEQDGNQRYLSQMDFPAEVVNKLVAPGKAGLLSGETLKNSARSLIAQSDPVAKFFVEQAFGKSAFRGRNLDDLESTTGRLAANLTGAEEPLWKSNVLDNVLANSPASRYLGTATQAGDDRKGWGTFGLNTMSGLRLADVPMDKARSLAAGQAAKELMKATGAKTIESINFSKEDLAAMDPATRAEAEQLQAVLRALSREAKAARKKEAK